MRRSLWRRVRTAEDGVTSIEFAFVLPPIFLLMFCLFDIGYAHFVRNSFETAVRDAARTVFIEPTTTEAEIHARLDAAVSSFGEAVTTEITQEEIGTTTYWVLSAQMPYRYVVPPLSSLTVTLHGEGRAPVINYQVDG
ncbi:TadE/TadG family type IV pilus assembly protein [Parvularcula dongshanensis]|uniref:Flp pilus assembly protein TadG n=1 Tax=Parvularcula dongshanensis TaxID=1173995 RepID=A0A840I5P7_9PROT|nr:TadE/TadG family type IV pilus assembly protein [Parvularcula dongshanensis]MBB4660127.1 Flp pilus assembly protein TadG [Parvularcula dongshanensis]